MDVYFNSFLTDDDTESFSGQCRSKSDCTEHAVRTHAYETIFVLKSAELEISNLDKTILSKIKTTPHISIQILRISVKSDYFF